MATTVQISGSPAEIYEQHMVPAIFARWAPDLVQAAGVRIGESALDVACGTGAATRLLAERVGPTGKVTGLDINSGMLAVARLVTVGQGIEWLEGSAIKIPLPDATFDAVICQQGLQFFPREGGSPLGDASSAQARRPPCVVLLALDRTHSGVSRP